MSTSRVAWLGAAAVLAASPPAPSADGPRLGSTAITGVEIQGRPSPNGRSRQVQWKSPR